MDILFATVCCLASLGILIVAIVGFARSPRTPRSTRAIIAQYTPPKNVSILLGGVVVGERTRSMAAQLVDLAVRGGIRILAPLEGDSAYRVELVDKKATGGVVESQVLRAVFGNAGAVGSVVRINNKNATLSRRLQTAQGLAAAIATDSGLVAQRSRSWRRYLVTFQIVLLVCVVFSRPEFFGIIVFLTIATVIMGLLRRRTLTAAGVELRDHLLGLREYISLAEADRMRVLHAPGTALTKGDVYLLTEKLLGWAVLFGFGKEWARALEIQAQELGEPGRGAGEFVVYSDFSGAFDGFASGESDASLTDSDASGDFGDSGGGFDFGDASSSGGWGADSGGDSGSDGGGGDGGGGGD